MILLTQESKFVTIDVAQSLESDSKNDIRNLKSRICTVARMKDEDFD